MARNCFDFITLPRHVRTYMTPPRPNSAPANQTHVGGTKPVNQAHLGCSTDVNQPKLRNGHEDNHALQDTPYSDRLINTTHNNSNKQKNNNFYNHNNNQSINQSIHYRQDDIKESKNLFRDNNENKLNLSDKLNKDNSVFIKNVKSDKNHSEHNHNHNPAVDVDLRSKPLSYSVMRSIKQEKPCPDDDVDDLGYEEEIKAAQSMLEQIAVMLSCELSESVLSDCLRHRRKKSGKNKSSSAATTTATIEETTTKETASAKPAATKAATKEATKAATQTTTTATTQATMKTATATTKATTMAAIQAITTAATRCIDEDEVSMLYNMLAHPGGDEFRHLTNTLHINQCEGWLVELVQTLGSLLRIVEPGMLSDAARYRNDSNESTDEINSGVSVIDCGCGLGQGDRNGSICIRVQYIDRRTRSDQDFNHVIDLKKQKQKQQHDDVMSHVLNEYDLESKYSSTNQGRDRVNSPAIKYFSTNQGKEYTNSPPIMSSQLTTCSSNHKAAFERVGNSPRNPRTRTPGRLSHSPSLRHSYSTNLKHSNSITQGNLDSYIPVILVDLNHLCLCDKRLRWLEQSLGGFSSLRSLSITNTILEGSAALRLSWIIERSSGLSDLDLSHSSLGDDGIMFLASCLSTNSTVRVLNLSRNGITSLGVEYLARALIRNRTLATVDLEGNKMGGKGCRALAHPLSIPGCPIRTLLLRDCAILDNGVRCLLMALRRNFKLIHLDISMNIVCDRGVEALLGLLRVNKTIRTIDMEHCNMSTVLYNRVNSDRASNGYNLDRIVTTSNIKPIL